MKLQRRALWLVTLFLVWALPVLAQPTAGLPEPETGEPAPEGEATAETPNDGDDASESTASESRRRVRSLRALLAMIEAKRAELSEAEMKLGAIPEAQRDSRQLEEIQALDAEMAALDERFISLVGGEDVSQFSSEPTEKFDLQTELGSLLEPLVRKLKSGTAGPREIEQLKSRVAVLVELEDLAKSAVEQAKRTVEGAPDDLKPRLDEAVQSWEQRFTEIVREREVADLELTSKEDGRKSVFESTGNLIDEFVRTRGVNLLLCVGAFFLLFVVLRAVQRKLVERFRAQRTRSFYSRVFNVLFHLFTFLAAFGAVLVVLFAMNDWLLLLLVLLFLAGVGWASIRLLPQFFEQIRLLLNLGSVREGERLIMEGLPWRVDVLSLHTRLTNPELTGGVLRVPAKALLDLHSRPVAETEHWFPCKEGDWVIVDGETRGQVALQTPETVHLKVPGGATITYPTADFLGLQPKNLSRGFRVEIGFGIDYEYQAKCTDEIPAIMEKKLAEGLASVVGPEEIRRIEVEFREAAASSLDYEVQGDFTGSAADRYEPIQRAMARLMVESCNDNGWVIPFTQFTLHNAPGS